MKELPKQEMKQKEAYIYLFIYLFIHFHPLNYFDEANLSKEVGRSQKLPILWAGDIQLHCLWKDQNYLNFATQV